MPVNLENSNNLLIFHIERAWHYESEFQVMITFCAMPHEAHLAFFPSYAFLLTLLSVFYLCDVKIFCGLAFLCVLLFIYTTIDCLTLSKLCLKVRTAVQIYLWVLIARCTWYSRTKYKIIKFLASLCITNKCKLG